jgi:hypothetical protein
MTQEQQRLDEARRKENAWKQWGPYLSERQWGPCERTIARTGTPGITSLTIRQGRELSLG